MGFCVHAVYMATHTKPCGELSGGAVILGPVCKKGNHWNADKSDTQNREQTTKLLICRESALVQTKIDVTRQSAGLRHRRFGVTCVKELRFGRPWMYYRGERWRINSEDVRNVTNQNSRLRRQDTACFVSSHTLCLFAFTARVAPARVINYTGFTQVYNHCNHWCHGKAISIIFLSVCVCVCL